MPIFPDLSFLNPSSFGQPNMQVDPYARLEEVINGINNQPLPVGQPESTLDRILMTIANAASVVASPDPGGALAGQIKNKIDSKNAVTKAIADRQNLVNQAKLQVGFQRAENLSREQSDFRKEQRGNVAELAKEGRQVKLFKQQKEIEKDIQLATNKSLLEQNEAFEAANEEARNRRAKNKAIIDLLPDKYRGAAAWEANARLAVPGVDPSILRTIAEKDAGINTDPITTKEQEIKVKVMEAQFNEAKKQRDLAESKVKADIKESQQRGNAALISANAQMLSAKNQSYNNTMQNWATKQKLDIMETQFYKTPSGAIVSIDEVNKLPINEKYTTIALKPEENVIEQQKRIAEINKAVGQTQQQQIQEQQKLQQADPLNNLIQEKLKSKTPEQVKQEVLNSSMPQAEKARAMEILGVKPTQTSSNRNNTKGVAGSSVPLPNISLPSNIMGPGGLESFKSFFNEMMSRPQKNLDAAVERYKQQDKK